ncbi:MAG: hypothetical protein ACK4ON_10550, partial [Bacteroidia bacterium]
KNYYTTARNIPAVNVVGLNGLVNDDIYDPVSNTTHRIILEQQGEIIRDSTILSYNPINRHAWLYFVEKIAAPIAEKLRTTFVNGTPLKDIIRFIVLCKGVPFRILTTPDHGSSCNQNVPIDGLLCFLGENIYDPHHLMTYLNMEGATNGHCNGTFDIVNPYYNSDPNFNMNHFFLPNHYSKFNSYFNRNIELSYLISHLDGMSFSDVKNMIDSSIAAINSSDYDWFIDADPTPCAGGSQILRQTTTKDILNTLGITNYFIDTTDTIYTSHPYNKPVISYISNGTHTSNGTPCVRYFQPDYIQTQLDFTFIAGAVFNTAESFNVNTLGTDPPVRREGAEMGQISEFFHTGGTVGVGQVLHGSNGGIILDNSIMLPSYALGYTFIEAAYLSMQNLTDNRVVVGDPLTRIYNYETITVTSDTTITGGDFVGRIIVPEGRTLTIAGGSNLNFK